METQYLENKLILLLMIDNVITINFKVSIGNRRTSETTDNKVINISIGKMKNSGR